MYELSIYPMYTLYVFLLCFDCFGYFLMSYPFGNSYLFLYISLYDLMVFSMGMACRFRLFAMDKLSYIVK